MSYEIEMKRLKGTQNACSQFTLFFNLSSNETERDAQVETIRVDAQRLDATLEKCGLKTDFGHAVIIEQIKGSQNFIVEGLLDLQCYGSNDKRAGKVMRVFNALAQRTMTEKCDVFHKIAAFLPTVKYFPNFIGK